jgi:hypothetical protein
MGLNYDDVYSKDTILDTFSKGNIKFTKRNGIYKYIIKY